MTALLDLLTIPLADPRFAICSSATGPRTFGSPENRHMKLLVAGVAAGIALLGSATAHAAPLTPDYTQQPNGEGADPAENITPAWTPAARPN
ncbi:hypothetical protein [Nocardia terpenica]|uniref:Uncharacterized protein n=1 Tax=Nocardia terpenica TaxID=455432 RepID=A0A161XHW2_9NOCA|nr:hypothetical protein [Nocardia terpenica]KZM73178.1 hypothetical protein AWN90_31290 [Nocardia terpenica]